MTWHYGIFRIIHPGCEVNTYGIREVYTGPSIVYTAEEVKPFGESKEELIRDLEMMLADANEYGVRDSETGEVVEE